MAQLKIKNGIIKTKISGIYTAFQFRTQVCQIFPFKIPFRLNCGDQKSYPISWWPISPWQPEELSYLLETDIPLAASRAISSPGDRYPPGDQKSYLIAWWPISPWRPEELSHLLVTDIPLAASRAISSPGDRYPPGDQKSCLISWWPISPWRPAKLPLHPRCLRWMRWLDWRFELAY